MDESRIEDLEIRWAHQEAALDELTAQVRAQEQMIEALRAQVQHLHAQLKTMVASDVAPLSEETPPPHY